MIVSARIIVLTYLLLIAGAAPTFAQTAQWRLVREVRIGAVDGPEAYTFSPGPLVTARVDGSIFVVDAAATQVRVFDARGRHLRSFGGSGAGPGEFMGIGEAGWVGDTLWVTDPMQLRTTLFTPAGRVVRTIGPITRASRTFSPAGAWALLADGSMLARPSPSERPDGSRPGSLRLPLLRVDPPSGRTDTLSWIELRNRMLRVPLGRGQMSMFQPWDDSPIVAVAPDGSATLRVERTPSEQGTPAFRVTRFSPAGRIIYSRVHRYAPVPIPRNWRGEWAEKRAREIAEVRPLPNLRAFAAALAREAYIPAHMPAVTAAVVGTDGTVWLRREERGGDTVEWTVLNGAGDIQATVRMPSGLIVHQAQRSHVWGVSDDELDVDYVERYRVEPVRR